MGQPPSIAPKFASRGKRWFDATAANRTINHGGALAA